ncbi:MAG: 16S rRNA processing protein RimM [Chloroflexi bacterium]|nr:16S rRNA processing protein RimM [Chloroflexota bacterium]
MKRRGQVSPDQLPQDPSTGSPSPGEPDFIAVGRLRRPHGVGGEVLMDILTQFPERLHPGKVVYLSDTREPLQIQSVRRRHKELLLRFAGIATPEEAGRLRNKIIYVKTSELPDLPEGEYYHHQLMGLKVVDETGQMLGTLESILETKANDVYVVIGVDGKELLLPAVEEVVQDVDLEKGEIRVRPQEWH